MALVFLFHRSGYVREAALQIIDKSTPSAFHLAAIFYRLNDWVQEVRTAAAAAARRALASSLPEPTIEAILFLATRSRDWGRWQDHSVLEEALGRSDIAPAMTKTFAAAERGPIASVLRQMMSRPLLDAHLDNLATNAAIGGVRAVATDALAFGRATWPTGWRKRWIDKSMGHFRWERAFAERALVNPPPPAPTLLRAAEDRAAIVRKVVANALVAGRVGGDTAEQIIARLRHDPNPGVRERIEFVLRQANTSQRL